MTAVVTELGYIGLGISDEQAWTRFAGKILGMQVLDEDEPDRLYLRMDLWHHRIILHRGGDDDIAYVGWRVGDPSAFEELYKRLQGAGVEVRIASPEEARERHVIGLMKMLDPAGIATEIFYAPRVDAHLPLAPGRPLFGKFLTGGHGLGHIMLRQLDLAAATKFYGLLGFVGSTEYIQKLPNGADLESTFMHCNERQHTIAMVAGGPTRLLHLEFEYEKLEDLGQTFDIVRDNKIELCTTLGQHSNDRALTFYVPSPSGWLIEPGWNCRTPPQQEYHVSDVFGHDLVNGRHVGNIPFRASWVPILKQE